MRKPFTSGIVGLAVVLLALAVAATVLSCTDQNTTVITRNNLGPVGDDEAVRLSRQALRRAVKNFSDYEVQPYKGTNIFATNIYNSNEGYVLWPHKTRANEGFRVAMQVTGSNVLCEVIPFK